MTAPEPTSDGMVGDIADRLRGRYPIGPRLPSGEPEFGWQQMRHPFAPAHNPNWWPQIQIDAADEIMSLRSQVATLTAALAAAEARAMPEARRYKTVEEIRGLPEGTYLKWTPAIWLEPGQWKSIRVAGGGYITGASAEALVGRSICGPLLVPTPPAEDPAHD